MQVTYPTYRSQIDRGYGPDKKKTAPRGAAFVYQRLSNPLLFGNENLTGVYFLAFVYYMVYVQFTGSEDALVHLVFVFAGVYLLALAIEHYQRVIRAGVGLVIEGEAFFGR